MTAVRAPRQFVVKDWNGTEQTTTMAELLSQVRELCGHYKTIDIDAAKRQDLRKRKGQPRARRVLDDPAERMRKLGLETGYDTRRDVFLTAPLEPWTCVTPGSMRLYSQLMRGSDGASLSDYDGADLEVLHWLREEELVAFGEQGQVHALSDAEQGPRRIYPGAPVGDKKARVGRQLRDVGRTLVFAAFVNIARRKTRKRISTAKRNSMDKPHGLCVAAYDLAREANAIKAKRRELDEYRYLSVDTCRRIIRDLLKSGVLSEAEPPRPIRIKRSWHTVPRVFEVPAEVLAPDHRRKDGK